jgi:hypothetical protein
LYVYSNSRSGGKWGKRIVSENKKIILNPLSHANRGNVHCQEIKQAIDVIERLENALVSTR